MAADQAVVFGDAEAIVIGHLAARLAAGGDTTPVRRTIPTPRPARFVTVQRTGGPRRNRVVDDPQITVECWAGQSQDAHDLAQLCRAYIHAMRGQVIAGIQVYDTDEFGGPVDLPDPLSTQPRWTFTVSVALRYSSALA